MHENSFTDPDDEIVEGDTADDWVDVRMTDPDAGEWDVDVVVAGGRVEFVDLRVQRSLLSGFIACLVDDVDRQEAARILAETARRLDVDPADLAEDGR